MKVIVVGDIILDVNYISDITRTAPEAANIPVHNIISTNCILGGSANVANNLHHLGMDIELVSIIGRDSCGEKVMDLLNSLDIKHKLWVDESRKTTQKNRVFYNNILNCRYDIEDTHDISEQIEEELFNYIISNPIDIIVISDYNKGVLTYSLVQQIITYANENNIYTFVDPKIRDYLKYKNCFCFKPNLSEATLISNTSDIETSLQFIKDHIECVNLIITCGKDGVIINELKHQIQHVKPMHVVDVTGCGDIFISVLIYMFSISTDLYDACKVANYIAGISTTKVGNTIVDKTDIQNYIKFSKKNVLEHDKIIFDYEIDKISELSKQSNIVFTNGCFDILHSAHIKLFQYSKSQGDILVVGLNSDDSIKRLKGTERPINNIEERTLILSLFKFIDYIIIFDEDTPYNIIKQLQPDIIVKGGDYCAENIIGAQYCKEVKIFNYIENKSTSLVVSKIKNNTIKYK
jgi:D-beta-D-heptose 7-phosphate kinase/D-beta-D-heptose 1-phosphate adenosyltransferase